MVGPALHPCMPLIHGYTADGLFQLCIWPRLARLPYPVVAWKHMYEECAVVGVHTILSDARSCCGGTVTRLYETCDWEPPPLSRQPGGRHIRSNYCAACPSVHRSDWDSGQLPGVKPSSDA